MLFPRSIILMRCIKKKNIKMIRISNAEFAAYSNIQINTAFIHSTAYKQFKRQYLFALASLRFDVKMSGTILLSCCRVRSFSASCASAESSKSLCNAIQIKIRMFDCFRYQLAIMFTWFATTAILTTYCI